MGGKDLTSPVSLFQADGLCGTDLLAAETGDAFVRVHPWSVVIHRQGRCRALADTGAASGAQIGIGLRPQEGLAVEHRLRIFIVGDCLSA